uniref:very-long-chain (3R)-3-hydroxyacyl-CoA dehydratase n=1 Tax=Aegilops tauschii subsp. strangulata TaxID=200361 RepID=A0A453DZ71_AEGTS
MAGVGSAVRRLYLSVYNWVVFVGWAQVLYYAVTALLDGGHEGVYAAVERPLQLAQTAAVMEVCFSSLIFFPPLSHLFELTPSFKL